MLIVAAILAIFVYGVIAAMLGTLMPTFTFLSMEQKGTVALAQAIGLIIASVSVGPLIDNKGKKTGLVLGLTLIAIALWALPSAGAFVPILALLLLLGLGGGIIVTAANTLVSDIRPDRRASVMNFLNLFFGLGIFATPAISANVVDRDPVKLCYLAAGLATATLVVHIVTKMPPPSGERGFKFSEAGGLLGKPSLYLLALMLFLYVAAEVGVSNWLQSYLIGRGIPAPSALNILAFGFAIGLLIGRLSVSAVLIRVRAITVTLWAAVLMAITTYLMLQTADPTVAWVAAFCAGLAMAPVFPTTLAMVGDAFPKGTATAMGIVITSGWVGLAVSSPIIGGIAGAGSANLKTALLVLPAVSVMMIAVNLVLRPMLKKAR
jgi:fucose permease